MKGAVKRVIVCAKSSFRSYFRNTNSVMWMLVFPLLITSVTGFIFASVDAVDNENPTIYVQDLDDTNVSRRLIEEMLKEYPLTILDSSENPRDYVGNNSNCLVLIIPDGFKKNWVIDSAISKKYPVVIETTSGSYLCEISAIDVSSDDNPTFIVPDYNMYSDLISDLLGRVTNVYILFFPSVVILCITHVIVNKTISEKIWMRQSNYNKILTNTNLKKHEWALSQMLWMTVPGMICFAISFIIMSLFENLMFSPMLFLVTVCTVLVSVPLGLVISSAVRNPENSALASSATILVMLQLSGGILPLYAMPEIFRTLSQVFPTRYMLEGFTACLLGDMPAVFDSCLILLIFTLIFTVAWIVIDRYISGKEAE